MGTTGRFPFFLLLLLGTVFLASLSASVGFASWEGENPKYENCVKSCNGESDEDRNLACHARCKLIKDPEPRRQKETREEEEARERGRGDPRLDPEERARERQRERPREEEEWQRREEERRRIRRERHKWEEIERREREQRREKREQRQEREEQEEEERQTHNPYHFRSDEFQTFQSEHGQVRSLPRFKFPGDLQNYRVGELETQPKTFLLPHHVDAEFLLIVVRGIYV